MKGAFYQINLIWTLGKYFFSMNAFAQLIFFLTMAMVLSATIQNEYTQNGRKIPQDLIPMKNAIDKSESFCAPLMQQYLDCAVENRYLGTRSDCVVRFALRECCKKHGCVGNKRNKQ